MRLIDADALMNRFQKEWDGYEISNATWIWLREVLRDQPTIDAVPVVRCKDCINGKPLDNGDVIKCMMIGHNNPPYSYCWWGERREG